MFSLWDFLFPRNDSKYSCKLYSFPLVFFGIWKWFCIHGLHVSKCFSFGDIFLQGYVSQWGVLNLPFHEGDKWSYHIYLQRGPIPTIMAHSPLCQQETELGMLVCILHIRRPGSSDLLFWCSNEARSRAIWCIPNGCWSISKIFLPRHRPQLHATDPTTNDRCTLTSSLCNRSFWSSLKKNQMAMTNRPKMFLYRFLPLCWSIFGISYKVGPCGH